MIKFLAKTQPTGMILFGCRRSFPCSLRQRITTWSLPFAFAVFSQLINTLVLQADQPQRPNIVLIMSDDLGYSDLGCYGGEIETPNLDALAKGGLRFSQFYNTGRCWPSRAALLTGYYAQQVRRDSFPGLPNGERGDRPEWASLLPRVLKQSGYRSYHSGKWHLDGMPIENGFDLSYLLKDQGRFFNPKIHWLDDAKLPPIKPNSGYYGTTAIADHAVKCLSVHAEHYSEQPFFQYVAFTAPHFPLHALPEDIEKYRGLYEAGWEILRQQRWERIQQLQLVSSKLSKVELKTGPPYDFPEAIEALGNGEVNRPIPWNELTDEQKTFQAQKMELHAAMVDRMDQEIGKILKQLKSMNAFENTLILFLSDNGASAEIMVRDNGHDPTASPGSAASYLCLGPGWSTMCNTPFRRHKTWTHEGGISTPLIAHWPYGILEKGTLRDQPCHIIDLVPTILEVTKTDRIKIWNEKSVPNPPGQSLLSVLTRNEKLDQRTLWWSHEANHALRRGNWKAVVSGKNANWELYDLGNDRTETTDLSQVKPEILNGMVQEWTEQRDQYYKLATRQLPLPE